MLTLSAPLYFGAFASGAVTTSLIFIWFANLALATHLAPSLATVQNVTEPRMRALATALVWLLMGLLATGLGPTLLGVASDFFAGRAFTTGEFIASCPGGRALPGADAALDLACRAASSLGLKLALMCATAFLLWAAVHFLLAARTLRNDLVASPAKA
jgi:hypothetical protein